MLVVRRRESCALNQKRAMGSPPQLTKELAHRRSLACCCHVVDEPQQRIRAHHFQHPCVLAVGGRK
eukprot:953943-Pleurochrysis_carterae.AAC.1